MSDQVNEPPKSSVVEDPEESPKSQYQSNCIVAAILAFGSPLLFMLLLAGAFSGSGAGNFFIAMCPILILLSLVGFIWGLVAMIAGDPSKKVDKSPNLSETPNADSDGTPR